MNQKQAFNSGKEKNIATYKGLIKTNLKQASKKIGENKNAAVSC